MLWIQCVRIMWTKATRGGRDAVARNRLPRSFPMLTPTASALMSWEFYSLDESDGFTVRLIDSGNETSLTRVEDLSVRPGAKGAVRLQLNYNPYVGKPERPNSSPVLILSGETARIRTNGRYAGYSGQHYTELCFNAALGEKLGADIFTVGDPAHTLDLRENLF